MNTLSGLRTLRASSLTVTFSSLVLLAAGMVMLVLGGFEVKRVYERIAEIEELSRPTTVYGYQSQYRETEAEYARSSTALIEQSIISGGPEAPGWDSPAAISAMVMAVASLVFVIAMLVWVWRAHSNLQRVGIRQKYTPGKALAAYLIPVANLLMPFEAMRELHNRSHGEPEDFAHSTVEDVTAWWTAMSVGLVIFSMMVLKFALDLSSNLIIMTPLWMEYAIICFAVLLLLGSAFLFSNLARKITAAQAEYLPTIDPEDFVAEEIVRPSVRVVSGQA